MTTAGSQDAARLASDSDASSLVGQVSPPCVAAHLGERRVRAELRSTEEGGEAAAEGGAAGGGEAEEEEEEEEEEVEEELSVLRLAPDGSLHVAVDGWLRAGALES